MYRCIALLELLHSRRAELLAGLHRGRELQLIDRATAELRRKQEDAAMGAEHARMCAALKAEEEAELQRERDAAVTLKSALHEQAEAKRQAVKQQQLETLRYADRMQRERDDDDKTFGEYAQYHVDKWERDGKDTMPLKVTLAKMERKEKRINA